MSCFRIELSYVAGLVSRFPGKSATLRVARGMSRCTVCIFCTYRWKMTGLSSELACGDSGYLGSKLEKYVNFSLGSVIPLVLLLVFISTVVQIYLP